MSDHTPVSAVSAYDANPTPSPKQHSTAPAEEEMAIHEATTAQHHHNKMQHDYPYSAASIDERDKYVTHEQGSRLAPPAQQLHRTASERHGLCTSEPQLHQMQQLQTQHTYETAVPLANLQDAAAPVDCPACRHRALTVVEKVTGNTVHLWAALTCCVCCLGCLPYLFSTIKDVRHRCGNCGVPVAEWHRSGRTVVLEHA